MFLYENRSANKAHIIRVFYMMFWWFILVLSLASDLYKAAAKLMLWFI